jgi:hypothetical protein
MSRLCLSRDEALFANTIHENLTNGGTKYGFYVEPQVMHMILSAIQGVQITFRPMVRKIAERVGMLSYDWPVQFQGASIKNYFSTISLPVSTCCFFRLRMEFSQSEKFALTEFLDVL